MNTPTTVPSTGDGHVCPWWLIYTFDNPIRKIFHDPVRILRPFVSAGTSCLDVGCGFGYFTVPMAEIAGASGRVVAVDLQRKMLDGVERRARRHGVGGRIILCQPGEAGWNAPGSYDFALLFWMLHEVPDHSEFLKIVRNTLKPEGRVLLVEPKGHVRKPKWDESLALAQTCGFVVAPAPDVAFSRSAVLTPA